MKLHEMLESKFLKKEDVEAPVLVTISAIKQLNVAKDGADPEMKWAMTFEEIDKPLIMNSTNLQLTAKICDSADTDDWIGKQVVLYHDPSITFGGKLVGGIRVRAPKAKPKSKSPEIEEAEF